MSSSVSKMTPASPTKSSKFSTKSKTKTTVLVTLAVDEICQLETGKKMSPSVDKILLAVYNIKGSNAVDCCLLCSRMSGCDYFEFSLISNRQSNCSFFSFLDQSSIFRFNILMGKLFDNRFYPTLIIGFNSTFLFSGF